MEREDDFCEKCEELIERAGDLPERAEDFAEGVIKRLEGMCEWSAEREHATEVMWEAVENIEKGIARWET